MAGGKYNPVMRTVRLYEESLDMQLKGNTYGDTENNDLTVLKGITKSSLSDGTFYLTPVWRFSGCDRNNLYPDIGYDTKEAEEYKESVVQDFRRYLWGNYMGINFGGEKSFWFNKRVEDETFKIISSAFSADA